MRICDREFKDFASSLLSNTSVSITVREYGSHPLVADSYSADAAQYYPRVIGQFDLVLIVFSWLRGLFLYHSALPSCSVLSSSSLVVSGSFDPSGVAFSAVLILMFDDTPGLFEYNDPVIFF